ncbi:MAG: HNH endonuclease [Blastocatellia bacterium]
MPREYLPVHLKRLIVERARGCCEYCRSQARFAPESFSIEHITPRSAGGETIESNLEVGAIRNR